MQGAFVVQLKTEPAADELSGSVEEVDTGKTARFQSGEELLEFLRGKLNARGETHCMQ
jgi:hypothetical protein